MDEFFPTQRLIFSIPSTGKGPPPHHRRQILEMSTPTTFDFFYSDQIWNSRLSLVIHLVKGKFASGRPHPYTKSQWFKKFGDSTLCQQVNNIISDWVAHAPLAGCYFRFSISNPRNYFLPLITEYTMQTAVFLSVHTSKSTAAGGFWWSFETQQICESQHSNPRKWLDGR